MDRVLIVDDDENIRLTLSQALGTLSIEVHTAATGEEALSKVEGDSFSLILLDLRLPGMDGMAVLRDLRTTRPEIPVVIITAQGSIELGVEAMKLGTIDFLSKPFVPEEIRAITKRVLDRGKLRETEAADYATRFELAKRCLTSHNVEGAIEHLKQAISLAPERPEAFNLLGAIHEFRGERHEALNNYRVAWNFDATYEPSRKNIERATSVHPLSQPIELGELRE